MQLIRLIITPTKGIQYKYIGYNFPVCLSAVDGYHQGAAP